MFITCPHFFPVDPNAGLLKTWIYCIIHRVVVRFHADCRSRSLSGLCDRAGWFRLLLVGWLAPATNSMAPTWWWSPLKADQRAFFLPPHLSSSPSNLPVIQNMFRGAINSSMWNSLSHGLLLLRYNKTKTYSRMLSLNEHRFISMNSTWKKARTNTGFLVIHLLSHTYSNECLVDIPLSTLFSHLSAEQTLLNRSQSF